MDLVVYGHFYQPPREDPFSGNVRQEPSAAPYHDWNERITAECYRPNAELGNFRRLSFDLGPTLAAWMETHSPSTHRRIVRSNAGNALAQTYHHTILPLANRRDKLTQVRWGLADFRHRFRRKAEGIWLPETAVDLETLEVLAECGIRYTILAPWQAQREVDVSRPWRVDLPGRREITLFFFHAPLSGSVSFDPWATEDPVRFARQVLPDVAGAPSEADGLLLIASDGELYGHHQPGRDAFLRRLLYEEAAAAGYRVTHLGKLLAAMPPGGQVQVREHSAWSCHHGLDRWQRGCPCTPGDSSWKGPLRLALDAFSRDLAELSEARCRGRLDDFWRARDEYILVKLGQVRADDFLRMHQARSLSAEDERAILDLLEAHWYGQQMFVSCAWFWEDVDRIEPRNALAYAARTAALVERACADSLDGGLLRQLEAVHSPSSGRSAGELYRQAAARAAGAGQAVA